MVNPKYPPRKGDHNRSRRSPGFKTSQLDRALNKVPYRGSGGKPPKKGGLCVQIAPQAAVPALMLLGNAIAQSFI